MNIKAAMQALSLLLSILPLVIAFVQQFETLLAGSPGAEKLKAVLAAVEAYLVKIEADAAVIAAAKSQLEPLIAGLVAAFNVSGLFKKSSPSTTLAPAT